MAGGSLLYMQQVASRNVPAGSKMPRTHCAIYQCRTKVTAQRYRLVLKSATDNQAANETAAHVILCSSSSRRPNGSRIPTGSLCQLPMPDKGHSSKVQTRFQISDGQSSRELTRGTWDSLLVVRPSVGVSRHMKGCPLGRRGGALGGLRSSGTAKAACAC